MVFEVQDESNEERSGGGLPKLISTFAADSVQMCKQWESHSRLTTTKCIRYELFLIDKIMVNSEFNIHKYLTFIFASS